MAVIYPDVEPLIVAHLVNELAAIDTELTAGVRVATKKAAPEVAQPAKQVVVLAQYGRDLDEVRKALTCSLDIWCDDYQTANELALVVAAAIKTIVSDPIKLAEVTLGPSRLSEKSEEEHRIISVDMIVKGTNF